jgi:acyl-CoA synthetase (AMP-forming)/AMP-acid ligase II
VIFTDAVPRTSVGKADKKRMRAEYQDIYLNETGHG